MQSVLPEHDERLGCRMFMLANHDERIRLGSLAERVDSFRYADSSMRAKPGDADRSKWVISKEGFRHKGFYVSGK